MTEKEMHFHVAMKWFIIVNYDYINAIQYMIDKKINFKANCAYCEVYNSDDAYDCPGCPLNEIDECCKSTHSWYDNYANNKYLDIPALVKFYAEKIYRFARNKYKEL